MSARISSVAPYTHIMPSQFISLRLAQLIVRVAIPVSIIGTAFGYLDDPLVQDYGLTSFTANSIRTCIWLGCELFCEMQYDKARITGSEVTPHVTSAVSCAFKSIFRR